MTTIDDLRSTIVPKSDQLNSEQLLAGPITVRVTDVRVGSTDEQPISVHYEGENGRPFKPCKTMRKVLIFAWGPDGREWIGRSMTLYNDPQVRFGGAEVGGIRISSLSDIERDIAVNLTASKGKKALHTIKRMEVEEKEKERSLDDVLSIVETVNGRNGKAAVELMINDLPEESRAIAREALEKRIHHLTAARK